ncbi:class I SAM-dependent rRNA methyltransferase [Thermosulfurimonas marina]|uniref:Class I SAM-dependent rRNA methyltransferase n=1 Tax=Thermosulfurimonas marina TaxID=2047767 RepID=A0A6H1WQZ6_9BACT|nr:class I SAM-dependent rRNA methyltransferase [Thermosulfurimonas marina]QJA05613.1 class I SAM-dependent rRNA methyltransferase [Thermosulfurimonas marina]
MGKPPEIRVRAEAARRVASGRLWLTRRDLLKVPEIGPGEEVRLLSPEGFFLARGYFNPQSRIPVRIYSREDHPLDRHFLSGALRRALALRQRLYAGEEAFRLVHAEGDGLPGLTVDVYGRAAVVQISTAGMERVREEVLWALKEVLAPEAVILRNDLPVRKEEGLSLYTEVAYGRLSGPLEVRLDGLRFLVDPLRGQKTGFFLDQRENRRFIARLSRDLVVLDLFAYTGAFGLYALSGGARRVFAVERSAEALALAEENARLNGYSQRFFPIQGRVEEFLREAPDAQLVILDPPAFIKSERAREAGRRKYAEVNRLALSALREGFFFTSSCSRFLSAEDLLSLVRRAARGRPLRLLFRHFQAPDHPENPAHPETLYLKGFTFVSG